MNTYTNHHQINPAVAVLSDGTVVLTWSSYGQDGDMYGIYAQRFNAGGTALGGEFRVNTYTTGNQNGAVVALDAVGNFVVVE